MATVRYGILPRFVQVVTIQRLYVPVAAAEGEIVDLGPAQETYEGAMQIINDVALELANQGER